MKVLLFTCLTSVLLFDYSSGNSRPSWALKHYPPPPPPRGVERRSSVTELYFTQRLDNFDQRSEETWFQRYYVNSEYFSNATSISNTVFLMLGGESEASLEWMTLGSWIVSARKYGALLFQLEHRFYGMSQPFDDLSTEHLRYLSSEQALADAANFIKGMNEKYSLGSDVKWIVFGGSYAGSLAAWMRLKYPDLVLGAISSSGPLRAELDFSEYFQVVIDDFVAVSEECVNSLKIGMEQIDDLLGNPNGNESVTSIFNLCEPIERYDNDDYSVASFYNHLGDVIATAAQYSGRVTYTFKDICDILTDTSKGKEILRVAETMQFIYGTTCLSYSYKDYVKSLQETTLTISGMDRQWTYQTCTEFGWFQTSNREDNILGRGCPVDFYTNVCSEVFGPEFNETFITDQIAHTNDYYEGTTINVSNVVYVHGSLDPWHAVGLSKANNPDSPVIFIEGTSHCANMYDYVEGELPQVTAARDEVHRLIGAWLGLKF